jgi:MgtC family
MLVAIGAALFVLVRQQGGMLIADQSRVIQGIVTGIGFLRAGAIIKHRSEESVKGLTTDDCSRSLADGRDRNRMRAGTGVDCNPQHASSVDRACIGAEIG